MMLKLKNLNISFDQKSVISALNYDFPERGIVVLVGASGAGKTTLLRIISGLEQNFNGEIEKSEKLSVSYAFQEYRLFDSLNALSNVAEIAFEKAGKIELDKAKQMLRRLGFSEDDMKLFPAELSGGMKQRVSLARAFLHESDILLLDEPTKELDAYHADIVLGLIREISERKTVVLVTHRDSDVTTLGDAVVGKIAL